MEERYDQVRNVLTFGQYPEGYTKTPRQTLRRYAAKFRVSGQ